MKTALVFLLLVAVTHAFPLAFEKGKRYTFKYETEVVHSIPGGASKQIGLRLRCDCHVNMVKSDEAQIKLENVKMFQLEKTASEKETPIEAVPQAIAQLQQHPVEVVFSTSGQVKGIRVSQNDPEWCRNIKRGIINMLQIAPKAEGQDPKQTLTTKTPLVVLRKEPTIVGHCPVVYSILPQKVDQPENQDHVCHVTKTIQYEDCIDRPSIKENIFLGHMCPSCQKSLGYVPYLRHAGQVEAVLRNRFLLKATAEERHVLTPMAELSGQVSAIVRQQLKFHSQAQSSSHAVESIQSPMDTVLTFKLVHPEDEVKQVQAYKAQIMTKVQRLLLQLQAEAQKDISSHMVPQVVADLVAHLRLCDEPMLENAFQFVSQMKDETVKNLAIDALSLAGTREVMLLLKKKCSALPLPALQRIMISLVFVPDVKPIHVDTLLEICESDKRVKSQMWVRRQCLLSYSALVNRLFKCPKAEQSTDIQTSLHHARQTLESKVKQATSEEEKLMYLKAIGNAGFPEHENAIVSLLLNTKLSTGLRVECVWALRKLVHANKQDLRSKLIQIFADPTNDPELRMAVVAVLLDKDPSFLNMQLLVNIVRRELESQGPRSNQVASWVISKLRSFAYYDNNIIKIRARCARLALRFAPKVQFGIQYSLATRISRFSEKLLSGFEMDINKMNVPQSYIPRNTNARFRWHLMGQRFDVLEFGARVEGLEDVIQDVLSTIRSRQKRSIWSTVMNLFSSEFEGSSDDPTSENTEIPSERSQATQPTSRKNTAGPSPSRRPTTRPAHVDSDSAPKNAEVSMFMKLFNQEILYTKITPQTIEDLVGQIKKLLLGETDEIQTALGAMTITKDSLKIKQSLTKAFLLAHARQLVPTVCGLPVQLHLVSSSVINVNNNIAIKSEPTLFHIMSAKKLSTLMNVGAKVSLVTKATMEVHTPFVRVGLKMRNVVQMKPRIGAEMRARYGHSYTLIIQNPTQATDVLVISPDPTNQQAVGICGAVEIQQAQQFKVTEVEIPLQINSQHIVQLERMCYGEPTTGVETCLFGRAPDLTSLRFKDIPFLSTLAQTRIRVQSKPKDQVKEIVMQVDINQNTKDHMFGQIVYKANGKSTRREARIAWAYDYNKSQFILSLPKKSPLTWGMRVIATFTRLTNIEATLIFDGQRKYKMTLESLIDRQTGKQMTVKLGWNQLPVYLKEVLKKYEPQFLYLVQLFGSISTQERSKNKIQITVQLTSPMIAQVRALSPLGQIQTKQLPLQMSVSRFPLSLQEILEWPFGQCSIQSSSSQPQHRISIFDQKSYTLSTRQESTCQHTLVQDKQGKLVKVAVQSEKQGNLRLIIQVLQPKQTMIVVRPDLSVLINNQPCKEKVCKEQGIGRVIKKENRVKINLNLKHSIVVKYQRDSIKVLASPSLRDRLRGLCGDFNGEEYQELRSPQGKVLSSIEEFARSWKTEC